MIYEPSVETVKVGDTVISIAGDKTRFHLYVITDSIRRGYYWQVAARRYGDRGSHPMVTLFNRREVGTLTSDIREANGAKS